jgi:hypothetical protein
MWCVLRLLPAREANRVQLLLIRISRASRASRVSRVSRISRVSGDSRVSVVCNDVLCSASSRRG